MSEVRWEKLRPRDMEKRVNEFPVVYVPFGSLEWHGYHNPLGLDTIKARALCLRSAEKSGGIVTPATYWPIGGLLHPWTVRMSEEMVHDLAVAIFQQMAHVGFKVVIALTGHYGIEQVYHIKKSALEVMYQTGLSIYALPEYEVVADEGYRGDHAAKWETSLTQYLFPDLVDMNEAEAPDIPMDGVGGEDPRIHASKELGEKTAELIIERLALVANRLVNETSARERSKFISASDLHCQIINKFSWGCLGNESYWHGITALWKGNYDEALGAFNKIIQ
ncbi:TPA: creatininase family protein [bacterium]|nr:creatininase family protein [bacterium]